MDDTKKLQEMREELANARFELAKAEAQKADLQSKIDELVDAEFGKQLAKINADVNFLQGNRDQRTKEMKAELETYFMLHLDHSPLTGFSIKEPYKLTADESEAIQLAIDEGWTDSLSIKEDRDILVGVAIALVSGKFLSPSIFKLRLRNFLKNIADREGTDWELDNQDIAKRMPQVSIPTKLDEFVSVDDGDK